MDLDLYYWSIFWELLILGLLIWLRVRHRRRKVPPEGFDWDAAQYLLHHFRSRKSVDELIDIITDIRASKAQQTK